MARILVRAGEGILETADPKGKSAILRAELSFPE
jgi:hypothetical protein